jgi:predicted alpha/beta-fold hydrolase
MIIRSQFEPATGLANSHLQTLLPTLYRRNSDARFTSQTLNLPDGDFVDLAWTDKPRNGRPIVILFHGLTGSIHSPYARGMMQAIQQQGWTGLLMHFRGCSGRHNRLARSYHSGDTGDAGFLINWLTEKFPASPLAAIGYSLGGNMLLKLQAELAQQSPLLAAVSISAPLQLDISASVLNTGLARFYQWILIRQMKQQFASKSDLFDYKQLIDFDKRELKQITNFWQFDDRITAPLHGFNGVDDYYQQSSSRQYLGKITRSTLIIHALDDPFMTQAILPAADELPSSTTLEISPCGGHVGFISGHPFKPVFWLEQRIPQYLRNYLK